MRDAVSARPSVQLLVCLGALGCSVRDTMGFATQTAATVPAPEPAPVPAPEPAKLPPNVHCEDQNAVLGNCFGLLKEGITCEQKIA